MVPLRSRLGLAMLIAPASAQLVSIGPYTGTESEGFET